ncbi:hypothetical protein K4F52_009941, partial [Lecanicillium sp. MT-2017a]
STRLADYTPRYIADAVLDAGLPADSVEPFIGAITSHNGTLLDSVPGVSPAIIRAGTEALKQSFADSVRIVYIIAAPFGAVACVICLTLGNLSKTMNYHVDAPVEKLVAKKTQTEGQA